MKKEFEYSYFLSRKALLKNDWVNYCELENGKIVPYTEGYEGDVKVSSSGWEDCVYLGKGRFHSRLEKLHIQNPKLAQEMLRVLEEVNEEYGMDQKHYSVWRDLWEYGSLERDDALLICNICNKPQHKIGIIEKEDRILCFENPRGFFSDEEINCECCKCAESEFDELSPTLEVKDN